MPDNVMYGINGESYKPVPITVAEDNTFMGRVKKDRLLYPYAVASLCS